MNTKAFDRNDSYLEHDDIVNLDFENKYDAGNSPKSSINYVEPMALSPRKSNLDALSSH